MNRTTRVIGAAVVMAAAAGWQYRDRLPWRLGALAPAAAAAPVDAQDVLYTWVDQQGVTHYSQHSGQGQRVSYDGSAITPLAKPDPAQLERLEQAAGEETAPASSGNAIMDLRRELQDNARQMQAAKAAQTDF
ncbi:MAG: DUF4124 domain-containing protein [Pseudomonadota bacterium]